MDVMRARVALRERSLLDVLDLTARFVFAHKKAYGRVALAVLAPAFLASWAFAEAAGWGWGWVDAIAIGAVVQAPFTALASRLVFADKVSTGEVLRASTRALPTLFGVRLVQAVAISLSLAFLILPVLWIGTIMFFLVEVIVLEHAPAGTAFVRASRLAATRFGDAMLAFLLTALIPFVAIVLADHVGRAIIEDFLQVRAPAALWSAGGGWLPLLGYWLAVPFVATARFFVYLDLRTRSEGWDIQTRFAAIAQRAALEEIPPEMIGPRTSTPGRVT